MYKNATKNQQFAVSHVGLERLENGTPTFSREEERQALVDRYNLLNDRIRNMKKTPERKALCLEMAKIGHMLRDMGKEKKPQVMEHHFIDAAKDLLTPAMFKIVMKEAQKRQEATNEPA